MSNPPAEACSTTPLARIHDVTSLIRIFPATPRQYSGSIGMSGYANLQKMMMLLWGGMSNLHETTIGTMWHACSLIPLEGTPAVITPLCPCCALYGIRLVAGKILEYWHNADCRGKKKKRLSIAASWLSWWHKNRQWFGWIYTLWGEPFIS